MLLVTPSFDRDGGVAGHVLASASALAAGGLAVSVLAKRVDPELQPPGVDAFEEPSLLDREAPLERRIRGALGRDWDVAHVHLLDDPQIIAALRRRGPVVVSAHSYTACTSGHHHFHPGDECMRPHGLGCIPNLPRCAHTRYPRTLPRRYLAASRGLAALHDADLAVAYSSAVDRHLAINGVAPRAVVPLFPTILPACRTGGEEDSAPPEERRVFFAGRLVASKGAAVLIRAAREIDAAVIVAGDGRDRPMLERLATHLGVAGRVRFPGWLDPAAVAGELAAAAVVVVPSIWPEPFGLIGIEALAAGRAVVASSTGGVGDWLQDGVTGVAVPPGNARALAAAVRELLDDPVRARALAESGRASVAARYTPERHVAALREAYEAAAAVWRETPRAVA